MRRQFGFAFMVVGASVAGSAETREPEAFGASQQAIVGGVNDPDSDVNNVVVKLSSFSQACTGTLITPQIVLTAAHCVVGATSTKNGAPFCLAGATGWVTLGASPTVAPLPTHTGFPQTFGRPLPCAPWDDAYGRQDLGLVFLQRPLSRAELDRLRILTYIAMPTVVRPLFPNVASPATLAIAGHSNVLPDSGPAPTTGRQTATGTWALADNLWTQPQPTFVATPGDSGARYSSSSQGAPGNPLASRPTPTSTRTSRAAKIYSGFSIAYGTPDRQLRRC